jgi:hypothetical protein
MPGPGFLRTIGFAQSWTSTGRVCPSMVDTHATGVPGDTDNTTPVPMGPARSTSTFVGRRIWGVVHRVGPVPGRADQACPAADPGQERILFALWLGDGITITQLAERTALQKSTLSRMIDRLKHAGLLRREPDPENRRTTRVLLWST